MGISRDAPRLYMAQQSYHLNDVFSEFRKVKSKLRVRILTSCYALFVNHSNHMFKAGPMEVVSREI